MNWKKIDWKDPLTDMIGLVIIVLTVHGIFAKEIPWMWDGLIGLGVGLGMFLMEDQWIVDTLNKARDKFFSSKGKED